ncbi:hypothetical protein D3C80_919820 [compost metagenome]
MPDRVTVPVELVEAQRSHQAQGDQSARQNRRRFEQSGLGQPVAGALIDGDQNDRADRQDIEAAKIIDALPGCGALAGVEPHVRPKRPAPGPSGRVHDAAGFVLAGPRARPRCVGAVR